MTPRPGWLVLACAMACADRAVDEVDEGDGADDDEAGDDEAGTRPSMPGVQFAACESLADCHVEYCIFPRDESGFCAQACGPGDDPTACGLAPDGHTQPICLDVGAAGETVCALDCEEDPCPAGMRCEHIDDGHGGRRVCF
jgi:hypothetical protein